MVSTRPPTSKSSSLFNNSFTYCTKSTNHDWYNSHVHVPQLFQFSINFEVLILLFTSFSFILLSFGTAKSTILQFFFLLYRDIGPAVRVFANGPGDLGSIPGRVIPKTLKMVLDTTLLNTQHYKVRFKGKVEQSWEWSSALPCTLV